MLNLAYYFECLPSAGNGTKLNSAHYTVPMTGIKLTTSHQFSNVYVFLELGNRLPSMSFFQYILILKAIPGIKLATWH